MAGIQGNEMAAATWCFQRQRIAGHGTDTLPNADARYVPMATARGPIGVLALSMPREADRLSIEQERLLRAFADLAAVAIEGIQRTEESHSAEMETRVLKDTERLQIALLNSISHDLRTSLVSIIGALSSLHEEVMNLDDAAKKNIVQVARDDAETTHPFSATPATCLSRSRS